MSISASGKALVTATQQLFVQWTHTQESWRDAQSREFNQKYLADLQSAIDKAVPVFEQLDKIINQIRRDCE